MLWKSAKALIRQQISKRGKKVWQGLQIKWQTWKPRALFGKLIWKGIKTVFGLGWLGERKFN